MQHVCCQPRWVASVSLQRFILYLGLWEITRTSVLDGREFEVRQNPWDFLYVAIYDLAIYEEHIWIYQVYIDQASTQERNH
jgi:hypothetical protein